jgi:hypothetical protein
MRLDGVTLRFLSGRDPRRDQPEASGVPGDLSNPLS